MKRKLTAQNILGIIFTIIASILFIVAIPLLVPYAASVAKGEPISVTLTTFFYFTPAMFLILFGLCFATASFCTIIDKVGLKRLWLIPLVAYTLIAISGTITIGVNYSSETKDPSSSMYVPSPTLDSTLKDIYKCPTVTLEAVENGTTLKGLDDTHVFGNYLKDLNIDKTNERIKDNYTTYRYITLSALSSGEQELSIMTSELGYIRCVYNADQVTYKYNPSEFDHIYTAAKALINANPITE